MTKSGFHTPLHWYKGSRDRGFRGDYLSETNIPEYLRLKNVQLLWDCDEIPKHYQLNDGTN